MVVNPAARPMVNQLVVRPSKSALRLGLPRVLIVGCGDVGQRCLAMLRTRFRVFAVTSRLEGRASLREAGAVPIVANLDDAASLRRLRGLSPRVLHLAPPPTVGNDDPRTAALLHTLAQPSPNSAATKRRILPERARRTGGLTGRLKTHLQARAFVYASTSGVYGDAAGAWVDESRPVKPTTARAQRRVAAERRVRWFGAGGGWRTSILRIP
ncbi:MAG: NAD-dependent epimerase/dehydratase family protein, partial [Pseudomonadota bacterium]